MHDAERQLGLFVQQNDPGTLLRDDGQARAWRNADEAWSHAATEALMMLAASGQMFNADDIRDITGDPPGHQNAWGSLFGGAISAGRIVRVGWRKARKPSAHARNVAVYRGTNL